MKRLSRFTGVQIDPERYSRLLAIEDYPAEKVVNSLVFVGGVGALGNELVKNLCLLGFRKIFIADLDRVEPSNLTRSVLFRPEDCGRPKVDALADRGREINAETTFYTHFGDVADIGLGVFRRADILFSDFDDLYPRYCINDVATHLGKVWIDAYLGLKPYSGGVITLDGSNSEAPCYVCHTGYRTYRETYNFIQDREGCQVKERKRSEQGFLPTTPTTCSIVAGIQAQSGLEYLLRGNSAENHWLSKTFHIDLSRLQTHLERPVKRKNCPFHNASDVIRSARFREMPEFAADSLTLSDLFSAARELFAIPSGHSVYLQPNRQLVAMEKCSACGAEFEVFKPVVELVRNRRKGNGEHCPECGSPDVVYHPIHGVTTLFDEQFPFKNHPLKKLGIPHLDILSLLVDTDDEQDYYFLELTGDLNKVIPGFAAQEL